MRTVCAETLWLSPLDATARTEVVALAEALRASELRLHHEVLRELAPFVQRWARALVGPGVCDDAAQEALCQIATALYRYQGRSSLGTFARRITYRVAQRVRRKRRPHRELDETRHPTKQLGPARRTEQRRLSQRLYRHLDEMREARRSALVLVDLLGMTPQEAAETVGCRPNALRNRLHHARRELRERLERDPSFAHWSHRDA